jgi:hypothetical protein
MFVLLHTAIENTDGLPRPGKAIGIDREGITHLDFNMKGKRGFREKQSG